jgi:two-component system sensor histidine kinase/response regulator
MDVQMPEMDGLEASRAIRKLKNYATLPIIAMTANAFNDNRELCEAAGMTEFLSKPVYPDTLFAMLLKCLSHDADQASVNPAALDPELSQRNHLTSITGLNLTLGLRATRDDLSIYLRFLRQFVASNTCLELDRLVNSGDLVIARKMAHRIKGTCGTLGLTDMQALAAEIETALINGATTTEITLLSARLRIDFDALTYIMATLPESE